VLPIYQRDKLTRAPQRRSASDHVYLPELMPVNLLAVCEPEVDSNFLTILLRSEA